MRLTSLWLLAVAGSPTRPLTLRRLLQLVVSTIICGRGCAHSLINLRLQMLPTLPTELVKHVLEALYDELRGEDDATTPVGAYHVNLVFTHLSLVSKTLRALCLPIAFRHIFVRPSHPYGPFDADIPLRARFEPDTRTLEALDTLGMASKALSMHV